jgi:hypothetical protein
LDQKEVLKTENLVSILYSRFEMAQLYLGVIEDWLTELKTRRQWEEPDMERIQVIENYVKRASDSLRGVCA